MLLAQSSGRNPGIDAPAVGPSGGSAVRLSRVPSGPSLSCQQLPVLIVASSHQKSTPLGAVFAPPSSDVLLPNQSRPSCAWKPGGTWPMWFPEYSFAHDVEYARPS